MRPNSGSISQAKRSNDSSRPSHPCPPLLIAITGGSGAGKSWLGQQLVAALGPGATCISQDAFYRDRSHLSPSRRTLINFDHPRSLDWPAFEHALACLRSGSPTTVPSYDFSTHSRLPTSARLNPAQFVIVEGLWLLLRRNIRSKFDLTIFIQCPVGTRLERRLARDAASRGRESRSILRQFKEAVQPMHRLFIDSQKVHAQLVLTGQTTPQQVRDLAARIRDIQPGVR